MSVSCECVCTGVCPRVCVSCFFPWSVYLGRVSWTSFPDAQESPGVLETATGFLPWADVDLITERTECPESGDRNLSTAAGVRPT